MRVKRHKGTQTQGDKHTKKPTANRPTAVLLLAVFYVYGNIQGRALSVFEKISALFFCVCVSHCCCTYRRRSQIQLCAFPCDAFYFLVNKFKKKNISPLNDRITTRALGLLGEGTKQPCVSMQQRQPRKVNYDTVDGEAGEREKFSGRIPVQRNLVDFKFFRAIESESVGKEKKIARSSSSPRNRVTHQSVEKKRK